MRALSEVDMTSSPGWPYLLRYTNNRALFGYEEASGCAVDRVEMIWRLVQKRLAGEQEADHIRLFVKPEPHKVRKLQEGRYRLISSVSVVDQIVDHMLFGPSNRALLDSWPTIPSKPGWSHFGGGWRFIPAQTWIASDKSSWDWTVPMWALDLCLSLRAMLCKSESQRRHWISFAERRYRQLFVNPTFITSQGVVLRQLVPGIMKSGCVNTIADNSMMQYFLHCRVSLSLSIPVEPIMVMGDDVLQAPMQKRKEYFEMLGQFCKLKEVSDVNEFAGFRFYRYGRIEPCHKGKHAFNLLHMDPAFEEDVARSYQLLYHRSVYREWITEMFLHMGVQVASEDRLQEVVDGL